VGGGSISRDAQMASMKLEVSASGDKAIRQTRKYIHYIPGQSYLMKQTATLAPGQANLKQTLGSFDDNNGVFFQLDGTTKKVGIRSNTSGSVVENAFDQSQWNLDKLDGTGDSGVTIDWTKDNIFVIDFQWLGAGKVRFGFGLGGTTVYCHEIDNSNQNSMSYMRTGSLPIRQEVEATGLISGFAALNSFCMTLIGEGDLDSFPSQHAVDTDGTVAINTSTYKPIIAIRLKPEHIRGQLIPQAIYKLATSNDDIIIRGYYNATITGGTWVSAGDDSIAEYNTSMTSFSGGAHVQGALIAKAGGDVSAIDKTFISIASDVDGVPDTFVIVAKSLTSSARLAAGIVFEELF
jgi:hypothetical protein